MYWILASERTDEYQLRIEGVPPQINQNNWNFNYGNMQTNPIPIIDIPYTMQSDEIKTDNLVAPGCRGMLINGTVKKIFDSLKIDNVQYFDARLIDIQTGNIDNSYCIANIIGKVACVDMAHSLLQLDDDGRIEFIDKLVLNVQSNNKYGHIFRLAEFLPIVIISNQLCAELKSKKITGFKFYTPEDFSL